MIKGIAHAAFNVSDMEKALQFYRETFGFEKAFELKHPATGEPWIVYVHAGGGQFIELFYGGVNPQKYQDQNIGYSHLCLEVEDIHEAAERIEKTGAPLDSGISQGSDGNWQCWTHDPDGNRIELMQMSEDSLQSCFLREREK
ncbi:MAG TPA: VOC family protein [Candidatus Eisenbergiella merdipullorum]|uniref:VOC family protein n=1 Tax=Candidatus Eisenbergiella merdipullorum TaxID=2838553 RepID=A0A9D2I8E3_9FIRM|nr:VOC family protein [Candidatus Eisenbergiella merdipullorum]